MGAHSAAGASAPQPPDQASEPSPRVERTPTSELVAPTWLAAEHADDEPTTVDPTTDQHAERVSFVAAAAAARLGRHSRPQADEAPDNARGDAAATEVMPAVDADPTAATEVHDPVPSDEQSDEANDAAAPGATAVAAGAAAGAAFASAADHPAPAHPVSAQSAPGQTASTEQSSTDRAEEADVSPAGPTKKSRRGRGWIVAAVFVLVLAGAYVGAAALLANTVPRGTSTLGVDIGGMSTGQAVATLNDHVAEINAQPITVTVADTEGVVTGADAGLSVDAQATVEQTVGFTLEPQRMWERIAGGGELEPVKTVDDDALVAAMTDLASQVDREPVDAVVEIVGTAATVTDGQTGITLDADATGAVVATAWPSTEQVEGVAEVADPEITTADADAFADEVTTVALAGPVTLANDTGDVDVTAEQIASLATVDTEGGVLSLVVDGEPLAKTIEDENPDLVVEAKDAELSFTSSHQLETVEGVDGQAVDAANLGPAVIEAAYSPTRSTELPVEVTEPEVSNDDLGIEDLKEVVATFDTPLTNEPIRTQNLRTAAADVEGTVILPGEQFNLAETLAPITPEEGYGEAHVIVDGVLTSGVGGGLSQMATTTYNVGYFSGFDLIQHRPHSVWFTRYPAGRESTLWGTTINVIFENNTPYAAVMNSYISGGRLYVDMWSTPHFDVETYASDKTNVRSPGVKEVDSPNCEAKGPGQDGFTITNTRKVFLDGEQVDENVDTWTYAPDDAIKCVSPNDDD
ncbi:VanW family protein [Demequina globuliformis]|uniref:VanW family protein n=1 Tax=Demequina globuliformis TaxID=676202 RepID=UPI0007817119|nr:VanW family protein [Demequina globuliformis]